MQRRSSFLAAAAFIAAIAASTGVHAGSAVKWTLEEQGSLVQYVDDRLAIFTGSYGVRAYNVTTQQAMWTAPSPCDQAGYYPFDLRRTGPTTLGFLCGTGASGSSYSTFAETDTAIGLMDATDGQRIALKLVKSEAGWYRWGTAADTTSGTFCTTARGTGVCMFANGSVWYSRGAAEDNSPYGFYMQHGIVTKGLAYGGELTVHNLSTGNVVYSKSVAQVPPSLSFIQVLAQTFVPGYLAVLLRPESVVQLMIIRLEDGAVLANVSLPEWNEDWDGGVAFEVVPNSDGPGAAAVIGVAAALPMTANPTFTAWTVDVPATGQATGAATIKYVAPIANAGSQAGWVVCRSVGDWTLCVSGAGVMNVTLIHTRTGKVVESVGAPDAFGNVNDVQLVGPYIVANGFAVESSKCASANGATASQCNYAMLFDSATGKYVASTAAQNVNVVPGFDPTVPCVIFQSNGRQGVQCIGSA